MGGKEAIILGGALTGRGRGNGVETGDHSMAPPLQRPRLAFTAIVPLASLHFQPLYDDCYRHTSLNSVHFSIK